MTVPSDGRKITAAVEAISDEQALSYLERYFGKDQGSGPAFTGAHFDSLGRPEPDVLTAEDIVAVACMSIHVPAVAALAILGEQSHRISRLLAKIPAHWAIEDIPYEEHDKYFGKGTASEKLWWLLRGHHGVGATTASKIMARKRPDLIPIYDTVVGAVTDFRNADGTWRAWHQAFSSNADFTNRLRSLRHVAGLEHVSLLRVLDVILWMHGTTGTKVSERVGDSEGE